MFCSHIHLTFYSRVQRQPQKEPGNGESGNDYCYIGHSPPPIPPPHPPLKEEYLTCHRENAGVNTIYTDGRSNVNTNKFVTLATDNEYQQDPTACNMYELHAVSSGYETRLPQHIPSANESLYEQPVITKRESSSAM